MFRLLRRVLTVSFLLSVLFVGLSSENAFASQRPNHSPKVIKAPAYSLSYTDCFPFVTDNQSGMGIAYNTPYSASGNTDDCAPYYINVPGFPYMPVSPDINQVTGSWSNFFYPSAGTTCNIDAWFPYGDLSSGTQARYDFWNQNGWVSWVGHDINQYSAPAGWNRIATNIQTTAGWEDMRVTLHNDGGWGNLAFAAMRFTCN